MNFIDILRRKNHKEKLFPLPRETIEDNWIGNILNRRIKPEYKAYDICYGAMWDHPKDSAWMQKQFKSMNYYFKQAFISAWQANAYRMRYFANSDIRELKNAQVHIKNMRINQIQAYIRIHTFERNIIRALNDQTCLVKPIKAVKKEDLITNFGLGIIIENFMLFNNMRFDTMYSGTGNSDPFGGEKQLEHEVTSVSITQEGYAIPYGVEARHGAPFLATEATNNVAEIGIGDSLSKRLYSRSVFPEDRIIDHVQNFDAYSINHITLLKAV